MGLGSIPSCLYGGSPDATLDAYDAASLNRDMAKSDSLIKFSPITGGSDGDDPSLPK